MTNTPCVQRQGRRVKRGHGRPITKGMTRRCLPAFLIATACALVLPAGASAGTLTDNASWLSFNAAPGETNTVTISDGGMGHVIEDAYPIDASSLGGLCIGSGTTQVTCATGYFGFKVYLSDGSDTFAVTSTLRAKVDGGDGFDTLTGGPANDELNGDAGDDYLYGKDGGDALNGGDGFDRLSGDAGSDALNGNAGTDILRGGTGADSYSGGAGNDVLDWSDETTPVTADFDGQSDDGVAGSPELLPDDVEQIEGGQAGDNLSANPGGSIIQGMGGADVINGGPGNDILYGEDGPDEITGNGGSDQLYGDAGDDRLLARDGIAEPIGCGSGDDYLDIDDVDTLRDDCAGTPRSGGSATTDPVTQDPATPNPDPGTSTVTPPPPPQVGRTVTVEPTRGTVTIRTPGGTEVKLGAGDDIPVGSTIDTTRGTVTLTSAADAHGKTQSAEFSEGVFKVRQTGGSKPVTELVLAGDLTCPAAKRRGKVVAAGKRRTRRLWGSGHGRFRTRGRHGSATVRGTVWLTEDRCDGTYTRVKRGVVAVDDFVKHRSVVLRAGKSYFAAARTAAKRKRR
jgi:Ca2+-binding RTX toxin-like protein